eukprot:scaffold2849_cov36-Attheya_sp.AAC.1
MIGVDTKDDKGVTDILGYRMKIVAHDFNHGWGIQPYKDLCQAEMCLVCREEIWEMSSSHAQFTCYVRYMVDSSRRDSITSTRNPRMQYCADYSKPSCDALHQASTGLKWPLIIDFTTVSGSLIVTGAPI